MQEKAWIISLNKDKYLIEYTLTKNDLTNNAMANICHCVIFAA
jgi:hypothetical protein